MSIRRRFKKHLPELTLKGLNVKLLAMMPIMAYFMFSDLYIRNNIYAFYTRLLPTLMGVGLLSFNLMHIGYKNAKAKIYNYLLLSLPLMMYTKCLIHFNDGLSSNVQGTILVLFLFSLELKVSRIRSVLFFFVPFIVFIVIVFLFFDPDKPQILQLSNILPIVIIGFLVNQTQLTLVLKNFAQTEFLKVEKERSHEHNKLLNIQKLSLQKQARKLSELYKAKDKVYSIIAHDLRNPFNAIFGYSQLIVGRAKEIEDTEIEHYANSIYTTAFQSYDLLNNLLHWARLQTGQLTYFPSEVNVDELLQNSLKLFRSNIDEKNLTLSIESNPVLLVIADSFMLETIIRNLLSNAIKFTPKGGELKVQIYNQNSNLVIIVQDNGVGIPLDKHDKIFTIDNKYTSNGTENETGTGLGLLLCKEFVDSHNGTIAVDSQPKLGSTFQVTIPIHLD